MVSSPETIHCLKSSMRLSSVVPATITGQEHKVHELTNMDLAMKLHYIKGVYFFKSEAVEGLTAKDLKKPMFQLLQLYFAVSGRIRRSGTGRPFIKCNDSGVRTVEARCDDTIDEWLTRAVEDDSVFDGLAYNQALGDPDLGFSPLVFVQFTWFKCGGMSVGLGWANVLGDVFSASTFINLWGKAMAGHKQQKSLHVPDSAKSEFPVSVLPNIVSPNAVKKVDLVGDLWLTPNNSKMKTHTFYIHGEKINHFLSDQNSKVSAFEVLSAIIWKSLSKIKENAKETRMVTLCQKFGERKFEFPSNEMVWSTVEADFWVAEAEVSELVELILKKKGDENGMIEKIMGNHESGERCSDFITYGANLTFVNLEEIEIYELELKGQKPVYANYSINGVGDEGVVLVLPARPKCGKDGDDVKGDRTVTVVLPENQLAQLKVEIQNNWDIV
ncbi:hypothetical protein ACLB2K_046786 [Fragaria x ananassa]